MQHPIHPRPRHGHWITGLILIGLGTLFLLERQGVFEASAIYHYWPFILSLIGLGKLVDARDAAHVASAGFLIFLGAWIFTCLQHLWGLTFHNAWPMVLIAVGCTHIAGAWTARAKDKEHTV